MAKKYKGVCEITLTDKDGNIVQKTKDENIITNAVNNYLTYKPHELLFSNSQQAGRLSFIRNDIGYLFGGVLLFNETIPENPDCIYPPAGVTNVAHAGSSYSGANTYRGTLNTIESGPISSGSEATGYKFVWDFATSNGNGTIKSVCLTSRLGGDVGYDNSINDYTSFLNESLFRGNVSSQIMTGNYRIIKEINDTTYMFVKVDGTNLSTCHVDILPPIKVGGSKLYKETIICSATSPIYPSFNQGFITDDYISFVYLSNY